MVDAAEFLALARGGLAGHAAPKSMLQCQPEGMPQNSKISASEPGTDQTAAATTAAVAGPQSAAALDSAGPAVPAAVAEMPGDLSKLLIDQVR